MKSVLVSINTARQVNASHSKTTVNAARPMSYLSKTTHSTIKRPIHKNTTFKNNNINQKVNTVRGKKFNTARPKAVINAVKGNNFNPVKALACWVWKSKHKVLDHVSKHNSASITIKKFDYVDAQGISNSKTIAWNEFNSTMASAIICLATNQKFNFSKYIFESMIRNLDNLSGKFLMYPRKPKRKDTQIPQSSDPSDNVADEAVHKELGDRLVRDGTTASSLEVEQDSSNITKTRSKATPNESSSLGTTSGGGPSLSDSRSRENLRKDLKDLNLSISIQQNHGFLQVCIPGPFVSGITSLRSSRLSSYHMIKSVNSPYRNVIVKITKATVDAVNKVDYIGDFLALVSN
ncbi:hypothetical protein Tco_0645005 [Tanacetum coccineum]